MAKEETKIDLVNVSEQHSILCEMHKDRIKLCLALVAELAAQTDDPPTYSNYDRYVTLIDWHRREAARHHEIVSAHMKGRNGTHPDKTANFRPHPVVDERYR